jgi:hypothetical protein
VAVVIYPDCDERVAHLSGVHAAVVARAREAEAVAAARLAQHKPGRDRLIGPSYVDVTTGDVDAFLNLNDPGGAAAAIEFGRPGMQGLHIITGAF